MLENTTGYLILTSLDNDFQKTSRGLTFYIIVVSEVKQESKTKSNSSVLWVNHRPKLIMSLRLRLSEALKGKRPAEQEQQSLIDQDHLEQGLDHDQHESFVYEHDSEEPSRSPKPCNEQYTILTYTGELSAITWREYLEEHWELFTKGLTQTKLLIICGVHGDQDGNYNGDAKNVQDCKNQVQAVSLTFIYLLLYVLHA